MSRTVKIALLFAIVLLALLLVPGISNAATINVPEDNANLFEAVKGANDGDVINITENVELSQVMEIYKDITINGNGNMVTAAEGMLGGESSPSNNFSMVTVMPGAEVILTDLGLENSPKYGVQVYDGGRVTLDGVTVKSCAYGGVLVNAGTIEIRDLALEANGAGNANGVEISKGKSIEGSTNVPNVIMNGTLTATNQTGVVRIADDANDATTEVRFENTENTVNKILIDDKTLVVTDENNDILYTSEIKNDVQTSGDEYLEDFNVTLYFAETDETVVFTVSEGTALTAAEVEAKIDLSKLGLADYEVDGLYADEKFETEFDFSAVISEDTSIYVKLAKVADVPGEPTDKPGTDDPTQGGNNTEEEIENPQTGDNLFVYIATGVVAIVALGVVLKIKKFNK